MTTRVTCTRHIRYGLLFGVVIYGAPDSVTYIHLGLWCVSVRWNSPRGAA